MASLADVPVGGAAGAVGTGHAAPAPPPELSTIRSMLQKKATFEKGARELLLAAEGRRGSLADPAYREALTRAATLLRTRYSSVAFLRAGAALFEGCAALADGEERSILLERLKWCKERLEEAGAERPPAAPVRGAFEGQLSGAVEPEAGIGIGPLLSTAGGPALEALIGAGGGAGGLEAVLAATLAREGAGGAGGQRVLDLAGLHEIASRLGRGEIDPAEFERLLRAAVETGVAGVRGETPARDGAELGGDAAVGQGRGDRDDRPLGDADSPRRAEPDEAAETPEAGRGGEGGDTPGAPSPPPENPFGAFGSSQHVLQTEEEFDRALRAALEASAAEAAGASAAPPASRAFVRTLRRETATPELLGGLLGGSRGAACPVCTCEIIPGERLLLMPCRHAFHPGCIEPWLAERNSCPTCRRELPTDDGAYERRKEEEEAQKGAANALSHNEFAYL